MLGKNRLVQGVYVMGGEGEGMGEERETLKKRIIVYCLLERATANRKHMITVI